MRKAYSRIVDGRWRTGLFALLAALCLLCITATATFADTVNIYDRAGVLDQTKVGNEASSLSYPIDIYTTNNFTGSTSSFDQTAKNSLKKSNLIVIAIDTTHRHLAIVGASGVSLSNSQYTDARNAFASNFHNNDYTSATVAAVQSLRGASGNSGGVSVPGLGGSAAGGIGFGTICCIGFLILAAIAVFAVVRGRKRGTGGGFFNRGFNRGPVAPPYDPNYNQYNQGGYPPNYGPGYNQNQGMNPLAAGGLGAAAGGLLGYELGKEQGERDNNGGNNDGGNFGGGSSGDFGGGNNDGGGSSGDFGGGNNDGGGFGGGSSGDFGGGGGGDFGGGGDSGSSGSF
ncbi:MAG: TPM domain-containing protein [Ktedonobacteraceae bacterium]|nr:TPM domain-containing protein [Ktedonobacteraceae bacterium]